MSDRTGTILAVDDSQDDLTLLQMAFRKTGNTLPLRLAEGGEEALAYLEGKGKYSDRQAYPMPTLILLDLKMPKVNGFDVLKRIAEMDLTPAPFVVVMSSSSLPRDIERAHELGAFAYHTKPSAFTDLCAMVERFSSFFCGSSVETRTDAVLV